MSELRFDGRVGVVTGAGRGIGRAYALLLAARGASVVVNDLGGSMAGEGTDDGPAAAVVDEIEAAGGSAIADTSDVSSSAGAEALVVTAIERFGRLDALAPSQVDASEPACRRPPAAPPPDALQTPARATRPARLGTHTHHARSTQR